MRWVETNDRLSCATELDNFPIPQMGSSSHRFQTSTVGRRIAKSVFISLWWRKQTSALHQPCLNCGARLVSASSGVARADLSRREMVVRAEGVDLLCDVVPVGRVSGVGTEEIVAHVLPCRHRAQ